MFRIQHETVNDNVFLDSGNRTFLGDGGIDIILGTSNSSQTPANSHIALEHGVATRIRGGSWTNSVAGHNQGVHVVGDNVGVGVGNPTATLNVVGPNATGQFFNAQRDGAAGAVFCRVNASSAPYNHFIFHNGYVGIGAASPGGSSTSSAALLTVCGRTSIIADAGTELQIGGASTYAWMEAWDNSSDRTPKRTIALNPWGGNVGIGTTSVTLGETLHVGGGALHLGACSNTGSSHALTFYNESTLSQTTSWKGIRQCLYLSLIHI